MNEPTGCSPDWSAAACAHWPTVLFYPVSDGPSALPGIRQAKLVCARCPIQAACLAHALATRESYGIWGGCTERERRRLLLYRSRRHGAPEPAFESGAITA